MKIKPLEAKSFKRFLYNEKHAIVAWWEEVNRFIFFYTPEYHPVGNRALRKASQAWIS